MTAHAERTIYGRVLAPVTLALQARCRERAAPGQRLGLVVVKRLAEQMGGRVEVSSEAGRGTRFSLWLMRA